MKPDFIFTLIVIALGAAGLYWNSRNSQDYLNELPAPIGPEKSAQVTVRMLGGTAKKPAFDQKTNHGLGTVDSDLSHSLESAANSSTDEAASSWESDYSNWFGALSENISKASNVEFVESVATCRIRLTKDNEIHELDMSAVQIHQEDDVVFLKLANGSTISFDGLVNSSAVVRATDHLKASCEP